ncbi:TrlF family AAA-like ATPase [Ruminococcus difficilis]|uniref:Polymerase/histidinol phosphatase N-terminal domain-containing protein n=1 Tax=Ruminococcus difficilis TaxID=2763069 RepID=A0A934WRV1_9FIRM|nr:hypothetical protein [Ruminococcus difficilis]MBK6088775.1 hypothetical protein [Ruminococcus difficilis]
MNSLRGSEWNRWDLHLHTASSYDYKYKANDSDDLLCQTLRENNIKAVAITDHFTIDMDRIKSLRAKAPEIVFFPGVELRTDKGSNNLHLILIFSEQSDLDALSSDFEVIMKRGSAKAADSDETIYWDFNDIVDFAKKHDALISIHAGRKTNGLDKEITNSLPVNEAIKAEIADNIHFFELGQKRDISDYETYVFKDVDRKPLIMCSDCHHPNQYQPKESLWIKADLTFDGLKQCIYQPLERVYIGVVPPVLDRLQKNKQVNIDKIEVHRIESPVHDQVCWFDFSLQLNPGLVAIIGNKGSGKSALSDILGHMCKCSTMDNASFLNNFRFRKLPKNYANDYNATLTWADEEKYHNLLIESDYGLSIEDAQYLPQKYIEDVCNNIDDTFQREIDKVIFSYVDRTERGEAFNLNELVQQKSRFIDAQIQSSLLRLKELNANIIRLETKKTNTYQKQIAENLKKVEETLVRHDKSKPSEVKKPDVKSENEEYQKVLLLLNDKIEKYKFSIENVASEAVVRINNYIIDLKSLIAQITVLEERFTNLQELVTTFFNKYEIKKAYEFSLISSLDFFIDLLEQAEIDKVEAQTKLNELKEELKALEIQKAELISSADNEEKHYQKYLSDLEEWKLKRVGIIGDEETEGSLDYYKYESEYLNNNLDNDYLEACIKRDGIVRDIFKQKEQLSAIYQEIYAPVQGEIASLLGNLEDNISFEAELFMNNPNLHKHTLGFINHKFKGRFGRSTEASSEFDKLFRKTNFGNVESVLEFVHDLSTAVTENFENAEKKVQDRQGFYDFLYGLSYIGVNFKLKMGKRNLNELSPGERGIVLLIFYLALSKESKPIIIDQPEDNLDNQSVYSKLVPCICKAKQQRQVIIVTHNPNLAVACDAEQIVFCEMNKDTYQISYTSGAIENPEIRKHVIDVLEGTMPAFDLRKRKYN